MIYFSDNKFSFYTNKVNFTSSQDGKQIAYCNYVQDYLDMVKNYPWQFSSLTHEAVAPTTEQQARLDLLNNLEAEHKNNYESECVLFVEHGVILPESKSSFLVDIQEQYSVETQTYLTELKAQKWNEIKEYRSALTINGGYKASGKWFHSDPFSRSQQLGLVLLGTNIPAGLLWKTMDGSFVEMTPALAQGVFHAATIQDTLLFAYAEGLNNSLQALASRDEIASFAIKEGWPETYTSAVV